MTGAASRCVDGADRRAVQQRRTQFPGNALSHSSAVPREQGRPDGTISRAAPHTESIVEWWAGLGGRGCTPRRAAWKPKRSPCASSGTVLDAAARLPRGLGVAKHARRKADAKEKTPTRASVLNRCGHGPGAAFAQVARTAPGQQVDADTAKLRTSMALVLRASSSVGDQGRRFAPATCCSRTAKFARWGQH